MTGLSAHEIYIGLTQGQGAGSLARAFHTAKVEANLEIERADRINQLARKLEAGWEGEAGAAAFGAAQPLAEVSRAGANNLERTHRLLEQQVDLFDYARSRVKPVPPHPPETNLLDDLAPWSTDREDKSAKYKADSDHNVELYRQYDMSSYDNEMSLPTEYPEIVDPGGDIKVERPNEPRARPAAPVSARA
ncbi:hypothetical protein ACFQV2_38140 [Actinokineospora soli]|uniref:PPE family protein n=1 Tax=Actinokineospora soli TaxID=1048753 RepID=A0ABW2TZ40_9PSEU